MARNWMSTTELHDELVERLRTCARMESADSLVWGGVVVTPALVGAPAHALPARRAVQMAPAAALRVA